MKFKLNIYYQNTHDNILIILHNLDFDLSSYQNLSLVEELFNFKNESIAQKFIKKLNEESSFNGTTLKIYTVTSNKVLDLPKEMNTDMNNDDFVNFIKDTPKNFKHLAKEMNSLPVVAPIVGGAISSQVKPIKRKKQ